MRFYAMLGFGEVPAPPGLAGRARWLQASDGSAVQLHLMPAADATPEAGHIAVVPDGYEETLAALARAGHRIEPRAEHWGAPRSYVRDPAGNLVELMQRPPG